MYKPSYKINLWDFKTELGNSNLKALYAKDLSLANLDNLVCAIFIFGADY
jgi:hypothetical protein